MADNYVPTTYSLGAAAKKPGWHSRKNETAVPQREARIHYETSRGRKNRQFEAKERKQARDVRSIKDQLELIEWRAEHGKGESKREKARLLLLLERGSVALTPEMEALTQAQVASVNPSMQKKRYQREKRS
jgi:hypothetical protein